MIPIPIIGKIIDKAGSIIEKLVPDKDLATKINAEMVKLLHTEVISLIENRAKVLVAEMSGNWLQRSWRPILMLTIVGIVANNYLLYPYISLFWPEAPVIDLPPDLYDLMKIGVGGYVVGRSVEKGVKHWKQK